MFLLTGRTAGIRCYLTNDVVNAETGIYDPCHMYGTTNQDVFRWPAISNGTERWLLGMFIVTLHFPGLPLILWGEEQGFYILDAIADNYVYGRQPIFPQTAWHTHGCFALNSRSFTRFCAARISEHHTTTAIPHPLRNILKHVSNEGNFSSHQ